MNKFQALSLVEESRTKVYDPQEMSFDDLVANALPGAGMAFRSGLKNPSTTLPKQQRQVCSQGQTAKHTGCLSGQEAAGLELKPALARLTPSKLVNNPPKNGVMKSPIGVANPRPVIAHPSMANQPPGKVLPKTLNEEADLKVNDLFADFSKDYTDAKTKGWHGDPSEPQFAKFAKNHPNYGKDAQGYRYTQIMKEHSNDGIGVKASKDAMAWQHQMGYNSSLEEAFNEVLERLADNDGRPNKAQLAKLPKLPKGQHYGPGPGGMDWAGDMSRHEALENASPDQGFKNFRKSYTTQLSLRPKMPMNAEEIDNALKTPSLKAPSVKAPKVAADPYFKSKDYLSERAAARKAPNQKDADEVGWKDPKVAAAWEKGWKDYYKSDSGKKVSAEFSSSKDQDSVRKKHPLFDLYMSHDPPAITGDD